MHEQPTANAAFAPTSLRFTESSSAPGVVDAAYAAESLAAGCPPTGEISGGLPAEPRDTGEHPPWRIAGNLARRAADMLSPLRSEERHAAAPLRAVAGMLAGETAVRTQTLVDALRLLEEASDRLSEIDRPTVTHRVAQALRVLRPAEREAVAQQVEQRRRACAEAVARGTAEGASQFAAIAEELEAMDVAADAADAADVAEQKAERDAERDADRAVAMLGDEGVPF